MNYYCRCASASLIPPCTFHILLCNMRTICICYINLHSRSSSNKSLRNIILGFLCVKELLQSFAEFLIYILKFWYINTWIKTVSTSKYARAVMNLLSELRITKKIEYKNAQAINISYGNQTKWTKKTHAPADVQHSFNWRVSYFFLLMCFVAFENLLLIFFFRDTQKKKSNNKKFK